MSLLERTREIGGVRALGWRREKVLLIVLRESLLLSLLSGLVGIFMGMMDKPLELLPFIGGFLQPAFRPSLFIQATFMALTGIGGLYTTWWASRLQPVEAVRYE